MDVLKELRLEINETSGIVFLYWFTSLIFLVVGWLLLNLTPPNYQIGFPFTALGFAFFVFGTSINNSNKSAKKIDLILKKLDNIHNEMRKKE